MNKKKTNKGLLPYLFLLIILLGIVYFVNMGNVKINKINYGQFVDSLNNSKISEIKITPKRSSGVYDLEGKMKGYKKNESFYLKVPLSDTVVAKILDTRENTYDFKIKTADDPAGSSLLNLAINVLPLLIIVGGTLFILTKQMGGAGKSLDFGRSRAKLTDNRKKIKFDQVAGLKEEKEEVKELIAFLKNPKKFEKMGARIPKGVLLVGPPGTGKTLLARAVAGEANVPFYYISGSDFVELFVGVGASRVRDMFKQAKQNAPCLVFIDEIDAVGRQRGAGMGGGHDEREQTLNQLLTEMDGFGENEGIIIIAATNRPDVLDPALLRPGRFDRQVTVNLPDVNGREEILEVHAKNKTFAKNVKLKNIAQRTPGFSGADLENLLNEAALLTVRNDKPAIDMAAIDEATDRVMMGPAKKSKKYTDKEKEMVAYHESGHVVLGIKLNDANDVHKVTIIPRGIAGGYAMMIPREETYTQTKTELLETITGLLGGRVAEEITFKEITTGAHNDFEKATKIARAMVTEYGMSDLGPMQLEHKEAGVFLGRDYNKTKNFSDRVAEEIDEEMRKIINKCYTDAKKILNDNKELMKLIATNLMKYETLTKEQIEYLVENKTMPDEIDNEINYEDMTIEELKTLAKNNKIKGYTKMEKEELIEELKK